MVNGCLRFIHHYSKLGCEAVTIYFGSFSLSPIDVGSFSFPNSFAIFLLCTNIVRKFQASID